MAEWPLVGRDEELALLAGVLGGAERSLVVAGALGVGKSRLVAALLEGAPDRVVQVRATGSTATVPFGAFAAWAPGAGGSVDDRLGALQAISRGLLDGVDRLVVAVDDAHLLDEGSAALVFHLVTQTAASVVATVRSGERCPAAVTALWKEGLAERVDLQALAPAQTTELVERVLGGPLDLPAQRRLWALTEGTPLYLREVVRAGLDAGVLTREHGVWRWRGELAVGGRLADLVGHQLGQADPAETEVLQLLAFGEPLPLRIVEDLQLHDALIAAERRGLIEVDAGRGLHEEATARLAHPLYAEVLRGEVGTLAARDHQRRLATAATAVGWHETDPLRVATWWLESGSVPAGPGTSRGAAESQVEPEVFLGAAERAQALAEWELTVRMAGAAERAGAGPRATLIRSTALEFLGRWEEADELLAALAHGDGVAADVVAQAAVARAGLALFSRGQLDAALDILSAAASRLDGRARASVLAQASYLAMSANQLQLSIDYAAAAMDQAGPHSDVRVRALCVATICWALMGETELAIRVAELALPYLPGVMDADPLPVELSAIGVMPVAYAIALIVAGRPAEAAAISETVLLMASASDRRTLHGIAAALDGRMVLHLGRVALARQRGEEGLAIVRELGVPFEWPAGVAAMAAGQLGDVAAARAALAGLDELPGTPSAVYAFELGQGEAWLSVARGELSAARAQLQQIARDAAAGGALVFEFLPLLDVARLGGAALVAPRLVELAERANGAWATASARFATALAADDAPALDAVADEFETMGFKPLAADAAAAAASIHKEQGRRGSFLTSSAHARRLAADCDDIRTPLVRALDAEPALATLTDREHEVATLAARGLTNREIADQLYLSVRTVHSHLHRAYAKLGVADREQLALILRP